MAKLNTLPNQDRVSALRFPDVFFLIKTDDGEIFDLTNCRALCGVSNSSILVCLKPENNQFGTMINKKKSKRHVICDLLRVSSNVNAVANDEQPSENNINVA